MNEKIYPAIVSGTGAWDKGKAGGCQAAGNNKEINVLHLFDYAIRY